MTVLIADDEIYMVEYIRTLVEWERYGFDQILTAAGGSMAWKLIQEHRPQLLVTDIRMPKISGLDLSRLIDEASCHTKIIIISGYSDFEYAKQALRYGVSEYLVKPVLKADFEETLKRILQKGFGSERKEVTGNLGDKNRIVAQVKNYVNENYVKELSLEFLGQLVNLHPVYLSKIFKEVADINLSSYITDVRMHKAAELLEQTNMQVQKIMKQVGYQKSQYFSKRFKEKYGVTPKEYRMYKRQRER